jgi:hypothetical protein
MQNSKAAAYRSKIMKGLVVSLVAWAWILVSAPAAAQDVTSVSSCPGQSRLPVSFQIDCSHVKDAANRQQCQPFIENQACRVFPAYRKITGINLEQTCKSIKFTIYDEDNWPHPKGEGGLALNCAVDYLAKYSVQGRPTSKHGPYDVHELLHEYHIALGAIPAPHILFGSSMAEAMKEIGETDDYELAMKNMRSEAPRLEEEVSDGRISGPKACAAAETQVEESLYLEHSGSVYAFYRKLAISRNANVTDRQQRFNRMFYLVSGNKPSVKQFLTQHCGPF